MNAYRENIGAFMESLGFMPCIVGADISTYTMTGGATVDFHTASIMYRNYKNIKDAGDTTMSGEYEELLDAKEKLLALEHAGVDNWDGYEFALEEYHRKKRAEQELEELIHNVIAMAKVEAMTGDGANTMYGAIMDDTALPEAKNLIRSWTEKRANYE